MGMTADLNYRPRKTNSRKVINDSLAAVFGWFEAAPAPEHLIRLVEQLDAPPEPRLAEARVYSGA
jgi:hypothetical protein